MLDNTLLCWRLAPGIECYVYEYANRRTLRMPPMVSSGFEVSLAVSGTWQHWGRRTGRRRYSGGELCVISPSEKYRYDVRAEGGGAGRQVGLIVYPDESPGFAGLSHLVFHEGASRPEPRLSELLHAVAAGPVDGVEVTGELARFIASRSEAQPRDPLLEAKLELERTCDRPLYLHQLADVAGMHPTTFSRAFARRFGVTPIHYRLDLRINAAIRLIWWRPDLSIEGIAQTVGFEDRSYFHRVFVQRFGVTAAQMRKRRVQ